MAAAPGQSVCSSAPAHFALIFLAANLKLALLHLPKTSRVLQKPGPTKVKNDRKGGAAAIGEISDYFLVYAALCRGRADGKSSQRLYECQLRLPRGLSTFCSVRVSQAPGLFRVASVGRPAPGLLPVLLASTFSFVLLMIEPSLLWPLANALTTCTGELAAKRMGTRDGPSVRLGRQEQKHRRICTGRSNCQLVQRWHRTLDPRFDAYSPAKGQATPTGGRSPHTTKAMPNGDPYSPVLSCFGCVCIALSQS